MRYLFYICLFTPMLLYMVPERILSKRVKNIISIIPIILVILFRFGVGTDYFSYENIYNSLDVSSLKNVISNNLNVEIGYSLLMSLFKIFNLPYQVFVGTVGVLIFLLFYKWIKENSDDILLSLILYYSMFFIVWNLSALRQGIVMSIGTYFLFNKTKNLTLIKKLTIIALLSTIHISALFYLVLLVFDHLKISKKAFLLIMFCAILISFLPFQKIFQFFEFLPGISSLSDYFGENSRVFDFSGIVRLGLFCIVWLFLSEEDIFENNFNYRLYKLFLLGNSVFFLFKFSNIVASRFNAFTFILAIYIFVDIIKKLSKINTLKYISLLLVFTMSILYFQKEVYGYQEQVYVINKEKYLPFNSIFNFNRENYYNMYNNITYQQEMCNVRKKEFKKDFSENVQQVDFKEGDIPIVVRLNDLYGVINQDKNWLMMPKFTGTQPIIHGTVLHHDGVFYDMTKKNRNQNDLLNEYSAEQKLDREFMAKTVEPLENMTFRDIHITSKRLVLEPHVIKGGKVFYETEIKPYYIAEFKYLSHTAVIYMNNDQRPLFNQLYRSNIRFNRQGILTTRGYCGNEVLSIDGEVLWME